MKKVKKTIDLKIHIKNLQKCIRILADDIDALRKRLDRLEKDTSPHHNSPAGTWNDT